MKTFQEFILEAAGDVAKEIAMLRAKAKELRRRGDMEGALAVEIEAGKLQAGTQAKIDAATRDNPRTPSNPNSITGGGYAQTGRSRRARIDQDTLPGQSNIKDRRDDRMASRDQTYTGRYGNQHGQTGSGGTGTDRTGASKLGGRR